MHRSDQTEHTRLEVLMRALLVELLRLAPNPFKSHKNQPEFTAVDPYYMPDSDYDGIIGDLLLDMLTGGALSLNPYGEIGSAALEYAHERGNAKNRGASLSHAFNDNVVNDNALKAYLSDLPRRKGYEKWLAHYQRKIFALRKKSLGA